jgi:hypothetical protein
MTSVKGKKRRRSAAMAALVCALVASLAIAVAPAAAEEGNSAPLRPLSEGGVSFPDIHGPTAPEEYPMELGPVSPAMRVRQVTDQLIVGEYKEGGYIGWSIAAEPAHDVVGTTVPTTVTLTEEHIVTLIVHHRSGNPAAGGVPFVYPITGGEGWLGGFHSVGSEMNEPRGPASAEPTVPAAPTPCTVPSLHDLSLHAAKARLRAAHCSIGQVHVAIAATAAKGQGREAVPRRRHQTPHRRQGRGEARLALGVRRLPLFLTYGIPA